MNDAGGAEHGNDLRTLLARVAKADEGAFADLYREASPHLYAIALRIVREAALSEEILQEAFVSIWHHAGSYDAAKSRPITWLASIVRHRALDHLRRRQVDTVAIDRGDDGAPWEGVSDAPSPVDMLLAGADARSIRDCVDALDAGPKQAIALAFFHGLSHRELALRLAEPLGTVKSWVRRGLDRLRRCLEDAEVMR